MDTIINYNPSGDPLFIRFKANNLSIAGVYNIDLDKKGSLNTLERYNGECHQPTNHFFPTPASILNDIKILMVIIATGKISNYDMGFEIYQGNQLLKYIGQTGSLNGNEEYIVLTAQLKQA